MADLSNLDGNEELSNEELAPKENQWDKEVPKLPEEDMKKCHAIVEDLVTRYSKKSVNNSVKMWGEIQKVAKHKFDSMGIDAHVEIVIYGLNQVTNKQEELKLAINEDDKHAYRIEDGEFAVPGWFNAMMIVPEIIIDDWQDMGKKQDKAAQVIEEREKRSKAGDSYFG